MALLGGDSGGMIQILDTATLKPLKIFTTPHPSTVSLTFSPERHLLTWASGGSGPLISWDLQTGIQISEIPLEEESTAHCPQSITYSGCGTMFGVLFMGSDATTISIYDVLSNTPLCHHPIKKYILETIWTHGECLQFATFGPEFLTIWEVGFTSKHPPTEVESLPIPNNFEPASEYLFLPTLSRLAFICEEIHSKWGHLKWTILVWDAQHHKLLLNSVDVYSPKSLTFSSDGHFFVCGTEGPDFYLWKESSTGYILHQKLTTTDRLGFCAPLLSPSGRSIVVSSDSLLQLQHTTDSTTSPSSVAPQVPLSGYFILEFSPDRSLVVTAESHENMATVIDLKSSAIQLIIDAGMGIYGLRITGSAIIVIGDGKVITWNLPIGDHVLSARVNVDDSIQITMFGYPTPLKLLWSSIFGHSAPPRLLHMQYASISPSSDYMAVVGTIAGRGANLIIYSLSGEHLADTPFSGVCHLMWFSPDGHEVWCYELEGYKGWRIIKDNESNTTKLEDLDPARGPSEGHPWESSCGYQVTDDGWILNPSGKWLFWLPPHWRVQRGGMMWSGQFLSSLVVPGPEAIILEVLEE